MTATDARRSGSTSPTRPTSCSSGPSCGGSTTPACRVGRHGARLRPDARACWSVRHPAHGHRAPRRRAAGAARAWAWRAGRRRSPASGAARGHHAGGQPRLQRPGGGGPAAAHAQHGAPRLRGRDRHAQDQLPAGRQGHGARGHPLRGAAPRWAWTSAAIDPTRASRSRSPWPTSSPTRRVLDELGLDADAAHRGAAPAGHHEPVSPGHREHPVRRRARAPRSTATPRSCCCRGRPSRPRPSRARRASIVPARPVDGPSLVYAADLVVSAGGTMNREAALLGVPTWTTFAGELGAVDRMLIDEGRHAGPGATRGARHRQADTRSAHPTSRPSRTP